MEPDHNCLILITISLVSRPRVSLYSDARRGGVRSSEVSRGHVLLPVMEQSSLRVGVSPWYWLIIPLPAATGTGMVREIGLWNLRLRGSMVTMGDTATLLPSSLAVSSGEMGWAYKRK